MNRMLRSLGERYIPESFLYSQSNALVLSQRELWNLSLNYGYVLRPLMLEVPALLTFRANPARSFSRVVIENLGFGAAVQAWETRFDIQVCLLFLLVRSVSDYIEG
jgi:hypothetical protein